MSTKTTQKANVVYEGRSQRANGLLNALNRLNEQSKGKFKYAVGEEFRHQEVPEDALERLLEDGYEIVDAAEAAKLLGRELRGRRRLLRTPYDNHLALVQDSILRAAPGLAKPQGDDSGLFPMRDPEEKQSIITISE